MEYLFLRLNLDGSDVMLRILNNSGLIGSDFKLDWFRLKRKRVLTICIFDSLVGI